jgi:hypothetical protein
MNKKLNQTSGVSGQVGLILIMIMAAVSAVSLSLAGRSITGLKTSETDVDSLKAFKAAEAGLERALSESANVVGNVDTNVGYTASFDAVGSDNGGYVTDSTIDPGLTFDVVVEGSPAGLPGDVRVLWSDGGRAALKVSVYDYDLGSDTYSVTNYTYDGDATRRNVNKFGEPDGSSFLFESVNFSDLADVPVTVNTVLIRVLVLYESTRVGISPLGDLVLPVQQFKIVATGNDTAANVTRKISFTKSGDVLPSLFDHVLFTTGSLSQ